MRIFNTFLAFLFMTATGHAQITLNKEGHCYIGMKPDCSLGAPAATLNIGGGLNIIANTKDSLQSNRLFNVADYRSTKSPIFYISSNENIYSRNGLILLSDSAQKTDIETLTSTLSKIRKLRGISYQWKDNAIFPNNAITTEQERARKHIGLLAQEVEVVYPEVVHIFDDSIKGIAYSDLTAVLIEGIKELDDSLTLMNKKYTSMQKQIDHLQSLIETLALDILPPADNSQKNKKRNNIEEDLSPTFYQTASNKIYTDITYHLTKDISNASIHLYTLDSYLTLQEPLNTDAITGQIRIFHTHIKSGIYICTLLIDGLPTKSKQLIISTTD